MTPLRTICLYGELGVMFGRRHQLAVKSAAEAVRALCMQIPGLEKYLTNSKDEGVTYAVFYGKKNLSKEQLRSDCHGEDIRIAPVLMGSKRNGIFQTVLGVVLIVVGAVLTAWGYGPIGQPMVKLGYAMVVGGIVQLLTPTPKGMGARDKPDNLASYTFNGAINTQAQGNPVGVLYGELIIGSAVGSAGIDPEDQAYIPTTPGAGSGGSGGGGAPPWHGEWLEA